MQKDCGPQTGALPSALGEPEPMYSTERVAELFDVKIDTIRTWIRLGQIKAVKVNNKYWRIPRSEVVRMGTSRYGSTTG